ncbi:MAG: TraE/TraK family type IV conjugative transfer system protein [Thermodesulfobacteriota bacterium]
MDWRRYFSSYKGALRENKIWRVLALGLVISNIVLSAMAFSTRDTIVQVPANLSKEIRVGLNVGDRSYKESWGLFFAMLLGNVTPKTIDFVLERTGKYLSPSIYQDTLKDMYAQAQQLKTNNLTITYEPLEVDFDEKTGRVLVKGLALMRGAYGAPQTLARTYELGIEVRDYQPVLSYLASYERKEEIEVGKDQKDQKNKPASGGAGGPARSHR